MSPLRSLVATATEALSDTVARAASWPRLHQVRRMPVLGPLLLGATEAVILRGRDSITRTIRDGPLTGMRFEFDPRVQADVMGGRYEENVQSLIFEELADGDLAVDVGAHFGYLSLVMACRVAPSGKVVCLEPDPGVAEGLRRNIATNAAELRVTPTVVQAAVGAEPGTMGYLRGRHTTRGKLDGSASFQVEVTTLDHLVADHGVPRFVKIDVEGGEVDVLRGASELMSRARTTFVVETHSQALLDACLHVLSDAGYWCELGTEPGRGESYIVAHARGA